ncbi:MAG: hypothetical protein ACTSUO_06040 [Candidatus Thorarchaeota archaeon]
MHKTPKPKGRKRVEEWYDNAIPNGKIFRIIEKTKKFVVITGRYPRYEDVTRRWLKRHGINPDAVTFFDGGIKNYRTLAKYKFDTIKSMKVNLYYEDDIRIARYLSARGVEVVVVKTDWRTYYE